MPAKQSGPQELRLVLRDPAAAVRAYDNGLRMGMATFQPANPPAEGSTCRVVIELPFAGQSHTLRGKVVHSSTVATVVELRKVPDAIHAIAGGEAPVAAVTPVAAVAPAPSPEPVAEEAPPPAEEVKSSKKKESYLARRLKTSGGDTADSRPSRPSIGSEDDGADLPGTGEPGRFAEEGVLVAETPGAVLLRQLHLGRTGVLVLESKPHRYSVTLIDGVPAHVLREPELPSASTEAVLARRKMLSPVMVERTRWLTQVTEQPMLSVVMALGLITLEQFAELRDEQVRILLKRVLSIEGGSYRMYEADEIRMVFPLPTLETLPAVWRLAVKHVRRMTPAAAASRIEALRDQIPLWTEVGRAHHERLPLPEEERTLTQGIQFGARSLGDILDESGLDARQGGELLLTLHNLGLIDFRPMDASGAPSLDDESWRDQLDHQGQDHFGFLGLHWSALPAELKRACNEMELDLPTDEPDADGLRDRLEEIRRMADDKTWRRSYRAELVGEGERVVAAEMYLDQGEMALFRKDVSAAEEHFERAREVEPGGVGSQERRDRVREALQQFHADSE